MSPAQRGSLIQPIWDTFEYELQYPNVKQLASSRLAARLELGFIVDSARGEAEKWPKDVFQVGESEAGRGPRTRRAMWSRVFNLAGHVSHTVVSETLLGDIERTFDETYGGCRRAACDRRASKARAQGWATPSRAYGTWKQVIPRVTGGCLQARPAFVRAPLPHSKTPPERRSWCSG